MPSRIRRPLIAPRVTGNPMPWSSSAATDVSDPPAFQSLTSIGVRAWRPCAYDARRRLKMSGLIRSGAMSKIFDTVFTHCGGTRFH